jgi:hypothetical protein
MLAELFDERSRCGQDAAELIAIWNANYTMLVEGTAPNAFYEADELARMLRPFATSLQ